jgi:hypothetical protein
MYKMLLSFNLNSLRHIRFQKAHISIKCSLIIQYGHLTTPCSFVNSCVSYADSRAKVLKSGHFHKSSESVEWQGPASESTPKLLEHLLERFLNYTSKFIQVSCTVPDIHDT